MGKMRKHLDWGIVALMGGVAFGCSKPAAYDGANPAAGPGELVGEKEALNEAWTGGQSEDATAREVAGERDYLACDADCQAHCRNVSFDNPMDQALCPALWGAGYDTRPFVPEEACRRVFVDTHGRFPTFAEIDATCLGRPMGEVVASYLQSEDFVRLQQARWADLLKYNNVAVNLERIYDADVLVGKLYSGFLKYDDFVAVVSAHPVFTRRLTTPSDRAAALFNLFVGRPPFADERADMAKLYTLWNNGYHDHPRLGLRLPDAFIQHECVTEDGEIDEDTVGQCTSVLWGFHRVVLRPDFRAQGEDGLTWAGNLREDEWELLQTPGRIASQWPETWEHMVSEVVRQYLGYDLPKYTPQVIKDLVEYVLRHDGDIRAAHYAVLTSAAYLQSAGCTDDSCAKDDPPWTYGPLKQSEAEHWLDTLLVDTDTVMGKCDYRLPSPDELLEDSVAGYDVVAASSWTIVSDRNETRVDRRYTDLAQTLGGCPDNLVSGRFKAISILNTATQEAFATNLCNPLLAEDRGADIARLLPEGMKANAELTPEVAAEIMNYQYGVFFSRSATIQELAQAQASAEQCIPKPCTAESFARGACYALLSSSEMLFY